MIKKVGIYAGYLFLTIAVAFLSGSAVQAGCEKGDCSNGPGIYAWPDGAKYEGNFLNGKFHGRGTYSWADGKKYTGKFKNDRRNGLGTYTWPNGASYTGEWENGKKSGYGIYTFPDGRKNIGLWENDTLAQKMEQSEIEKFLVPPGKEAASPATAPAAIRVAPSEKTAPAAGEESLTVTEAASSTTKSTTDPFLISVKKLLLVDGRKFKAWENIPLLAVGPIKPIGKCSVKIDAEAFDKKTGKLTVKLKVENDSNCMMDFKGFLQAGDHYVKVVSWTGAQAIAPDSLKEISQTLTLDQKASRSKISFKLQGEGRRM